MKVIADSNTGLDDVVAGQAKAIRDAIAAGQAKAATVPLRESDGDNATLRAPPQDIVVEIPTFPDFQEFDLDLTCLSPPTSPPTSVYEDARSITTTATASPRHSTSLSFRSTSPTQSRRSKVSQTKSASPLLQNQNGTSAPRGSWPLVRYVGRGTPIDKNRRIEWGATSNEGDDVGEDGVFFTTTVRSTSIDSTAHPSLRSVSPDWNILTRRSSTVPTRIKSRSLRPEPPAPSPAIQIEGLGSEKPGEWASFVHTVLGESSSSPAASTSHPPEPADSLSPTAEEPKEEEAAPTMTPEQIQQLDAELGIDLGIDGALDLGLGYRGGMNWFNLGMLPGSGRETPSVYSSRAPTTQLSRPPSVTVTPQDNRSTASIKVAGDISQSVQTKSTKSSSPMWWRRMMQGLKKVPLLMIGSR